MAETIDRYAAAFKFDHLEPRVQDHLKNVYGCLSLCLVAATVGAYLQAVSGLMQLGFLGVLVQLGLMAWLRFTPHTQKNVLQRIGILAAFGLVTGWSIGPLLTVVAQINPSIITTAFLGTCTIFVSFTLASLMTKNRSFLYLGGMLMSALSFMMFASFLNIFFGSQMLFQANLYVGLFVFCGFVLFDTQMIIEKRRMGDTDFIWHSVDLFLDFIQIFVRLLIILTQKDEKDSKKSRR